jgi:glycyl-tRNA synthetase
VLVKTAEVPYDACAVYLTPEEIMAEDKTSNEFMDKLVALCKRRGFIFQSSEIYGGISGFWDYGPLGVELKRNIKEAWWRDNVTMRDDMVGLDCSIIMNPKVWEASGHVVNFNDPLVDCQKCKARFRADQLYMVPWVDQEDLGNLNPRYEELDNIYLREKHEILAKSASAEAAIPEIIELGRVFSDRKIDSLPSPLWKFVEATSCSEAAQLGKISNREAKAFRGGPRQMSPVLVTDYLKAEVKSRKPVLCPKCGSENTLTPPRKFNMMFKTSVGAMEDSSAVAYLRPETAQGIFANYKNVLDTTRIKPPFGIAQVGKSFRNEINPRNYTFRSREFEQMEIEFFCHPSEADKWYEYWRDRRYNWYIGLGLTSSKLRLRPHEKEELAHYARACADVEYQFPFGLAELEGIANRTDYDLTQHQKFSGKDMTFFNDETKEKYIPYVIEPSGGVDRATLAFLCEAYTEDQAPDENGAMQTRVVMKFHPRLAPTKVAVFPLVKKEGMPEIAQKIHQACKAANLTSFYDEKGAVGRRYRRQDEAGTPFCVTVDGQTLTDQTVTVRDRDSLKQERIGVDKVAQYVKEKLG